MNIKIGLKELFIRPHKEIHKPNKLSAKQKATYKGNKETNGSHKDREPLIIYHLLHVIDKEHIDK